MRSESNRRKRPHYRYLLINSKVETTQLNHRCAFLGQSLSILLDSAREKVIQSSPLFSCVSLIEIRSSRLHSSNISFCLFSRISFNTIRQRIKYCSSDSRRIIMAVEGSVGSYRSINGAGVENRARRGNEFMCHFLSVLHRIIRKRYLFVEYRRFTTLYRQVPRAPRSLNTEESLSHWRITGIVILQC